MAVNESRSMNQDLLDGLTDGSVKKLAPNRGGKPNDFLLAQHVYDKLHTEYYDPSFGDFNVDYEYGDDFSKPPRKSLKVSEVEKEVGARITKLKG